MKFFEAQCEFASPLYLQCHQSMDEYHSNREESQLYDENDRAVTAASSSHTSFYELAFGSWHQPQSVLCSVVLRCEYIPDLVPICIPAFRESMCHSLTNNEKRIWIRT